tara:strand:+ start:124 stop:789 length:666 start_codon:yes stop_codon:yes gene_type:complete
MNDHLSVVIPIRKGSVRVKNKNLRKFNTKNLLTYKILKLKKLKNIEKIIVNTDSEEAIDIAKNLNVSYFKRQKYFASTQCSNSTFWQNVAETTKSEYLMFTNCTSPLIEIKTYQSIINKFLKIKKLYGSINTVTQIREFIYYNNKPLNFKTSKAPKSQNISNTFKLNFAVNIISNKEMYQNKSIVSKKPFFFNLSDIEGFDIDTMVDFEIAEFLHKKRHND